MRDALESALDRIDPTDEYLHEEYGDDTDLDESRYDHLASAVLSVDHEHTFDVMLTVGGPTCYFRVTTNEDFDVIRVEYVDTWAHPVQIVRLSPSEEDRVISFLEPYLDGFKDSAR
jgi:hypothetical protein